MADGALAYEFLCKVADNPCPTDQQVSINDMLWTVNGVNIVLAYALGMMLVMVPAFIAWMAGELLHFIGAGGRGTR